MGGGPDAFGLLRVRCGGTGLESPKAMGILDRRCHSQHQSHWRFRKFSIRSQLAHPDWTANWGNNPRISLRQSTHIPFSTGLKLFALSAPILSQSRLLQLSHVANQQYEASSD
jgi:hypothetical protein